MGSAKGLAIRAPETAERVGLAGGAAGGAVIGAAAGSVIPGVGTAIGAAGGAIIGGAIGFFADLAGEEEGGVDRSGWEQIRDALSPYEEYLGEESMGQGGAKFFEDLGFVLAASSIVRGGGLAVRGVASGIAGATASAEAGGTSFARALIAKPVTSPEAGVFTRVAAAVARKAQGSRQSRLHRVLRSADGDRVPAGEKVPGSRSGCDR